MLAIAGEPRQNRPMPDSHFHTARDRTRPELLWFLRHKQALARWPVLAEPWAIRIENRRRAETDPPDRDIPSRHGAGR